jgi:homeobox protein cut-like
VYILLDTEEWNKLEKDDKFSQMVSLLRIYQKEVDRLTTRAKQGEQAFLDIYQVISKAPSQEEPRELARQLLAQVASSTRLEVQNRKLMHEIEGYKADFKELTSQDVTVRKQEEMIARYEQDLARLASEGAADAEKKVETRFNEELERKDTLIAQIRSELRHANETASVSLRDRDIAQNQINHIETRHKREMTAKQSEVDMLSSEIDTLNHTISELRTQLNPALLSSSTSSSKQLALDLASSTPTKLERRPFDEDFSGAELAVEKDIHIAQLTQELQDLANRLELQREGHIKEQTDSDALLSNLRQQLAALPTVEHWEHVKARLAVLEGLESYLGPSDVDISQGVDMILRDKLRKLERSNLELKSQVKELELKYSEAIASIDQLKLTLSEKDAHIAKMEDSIASGSSPTPTSQGLNTDQTESMLQVMKAQRDRLKTRVETLEAEKDRLAEQLRLTSTRAQTLQEDNVKLYQKMRYVQSFASSPSGMATGKSHAAQPSLSSLSADVEQGVPFEDKYKSAYEDSVNPFAAFNEREKSKRIGELNPAEKIILSTTSFFLATRNTRMILFAYLVLVHIFVVIMSYKGAVAQTNCLKNADA